MRELRRVLRYRNLLISEAVRMKNKISGLLLEAGEPYNARRLHGKKFFMQYLDKLRDTPQSANARPLRSTRPLRLFRGRQAKSKLNLARRRRRSMRQMDVWSL